MEDPEQMGYIHLDRFLPVMSRWEISCFIFLFFCIQSHLRASNIWVGCGSDENFRPILISWTTIRIILQEKFLPAAHEDLLAAFQVRKHVCMCWWVCACARSSNPLLFKCSCLWWQPQALDVDNTGHIDKEILTQIFTEEGEAFSEVVQVLFFILKNERAFQNLFSLGGDARVLQRCPRPGDQVSSLQRVCSLPLRRRQLLNDLS